MLKLGSAILSLLCVLSMVPALGVAMYLTVTDNIHPLLPMRFSGAEISAINPDIVATINGMGVFATGNEVAFYLLAIIAIWKGLYWRKIWVFWALLLSLSVSVLSKFASGYVDGSHTFGPSIFAAFLLVAGIILCALDLFGKQKN